MKIMNGDKVVAVRHYEYEDAIPTIRAVEGVPFNYLPFELFGMNKREVTVSEYLKWAKGRCFPENRVDCEDVLKTLGLKRYDAMEIVKITGGRLTGIDHFWIDFK